MSLTRERGGEKRHILPTFQCWSPVQSPSVGILLLPRSLKLEVRGVVPSVQEWNAEDRNGNTPTPGSSPGSSRPASLIYLVIFSMVANNNLGL